MSSVTTTSSSIPAPPVAREPIHIRLAEPKDIPAIDAMQKKQSKALGFMHLETLEGKVRLKQILVAEEVIGQRGGEPSTRSAADDTDMSEPPTTDRSPPTLLGYLIGQDQYFKRDDTGVIYQINVLPGKQRSFIGSSLLRAQFERSAYGCKMYCCWCAQDLTSSNQFWEAMGFVPIAFRAGSEAKQRIHIFWSKRIREGDSTTPWWFPSETKGGAMMEDRLVFPIPPGTHWSDAKPIILPRDTQPAEEVKQLESATKAVQRRKTAPVVRSKPTPLAGGLCFTAPIAAPVEVVKQKPQRAKKQKVKNDPKYVAAARELRDRYLEKVNENPAALTSGGKYNLTRWVDTQAQLEMVEPQKQLAA
jgi:ribosomal protein S18 acetylase RimI-like enzyme